MRYELKIQLQESSYSDVIRRLYDNKFMIREIYGERQINNIYFDTIGYTDYLSNMHGDSDRKKYRIRWYGSLKGFIKFPTLELKHKKGMTGGKNSVALPEFNFNTTFSYAEYSALLRKQLTKTGDKYDWMVSELLLRNPALVNSYSRRYFLTGDNRYRLTLDKDIRFFDFTSALYGQHGVFGTPDPHVVLEIKFASENLPDAKKLVDSLGYRINRNSKYVNGINAILFNSSLQIT